MTRKLLLCFITLMAAALPAMGIPGANLQAQVDSMAAGETSGIDVTAAFVEDSLDSFWKITSPEGSMASFIVELSSSPLLNEFGIYDATEPENMVTVFSGDAGAGARALIAISSSGDVTVTPREGSQVSASFGGNAFGLFLKYGDHTWYSDSAKNEGEDHFYAYDVSDMTLAPALDWVERNDFTDKDYLFAWEESALGGDDDDFTDMVLMMESVEDFTDTVLMTQTVDPQPLPEAGMTLCMLGIALMALHRVRRA